MAIVGGKPEDRRIAAHLIVKGIEKAIDFYEQAFGARVLYRSAIPPEGAVLHAQLAIADSVVMLSEENMGMFEITSPGQIYAEVRKWLKISYELDS
jgi:uncharacterized glyoxalase superfamily protein PhnB